MSTSLLQLPELSTKPRRSGFSVAIDNGIPLNYFCDLVDGGAEHLDFVKFGWGTSVVTPNVEKKIAYLRSAGIDFFFGGTLFEKYVIQDRYRQYIELLGDF